MSYCPRKDNYSDWCGECYSNMKGRGSYAGHIGYRVRKPILGESLAMAIKKRDNAVSEKGGTGKLAPGKWGIAYPALWEFLTLAAYDDGSARVLPTMTLFIDVGCVKACLNDRDQGLTGWAAAEGVEALLLSLDRALKEDKIEWKPSVSGGTKRKRS